MLDAVIVDPIEERLENHRGPRSRLTVAALLAAVVRNAEQGRPYTRRAVTETLNSFTRDELAELGVRSADQSPEPFSQESALRRMKQLEGALEKGWTVDGVEYGLDWFARAMISASLPYGNEPAVLAKAGDSTAFPTWAEAREVAADRGFTSQTFKDGVDRRDTVEATAEALRSDSGLPRGRAAAQIAATAAAFAHNRRAAAQKNVASSANQPADDPCEPRSEPHD